MKSAGAWSIPDLLFKGSGRLRRCTVAGLTGAQGSPRTWLALVAVAAGALALLWGGCSQEVPSAPERSETNVIVAYYQSEESFEQGIIELDGERIDREWGSEFTHDRPFTQIRLSAEKGFGTPGTPCYVSMKAVYTDEDLYLLVQWMDSRPDVLKDVFQYLGPNLSAPIVTCAQVGGQTVCDSIFRRGFQDSLITGAWWTQGGEDDKIAIAFEILPATGNGGCFPEIGCQVACHTGAEPSFGEMSGGRLDLWYWLAGRTNPVRNIFDPYDDDPEDPVQGVPGYLDDCFIDELGGLTPDEGTACYMPNFLSGKGWPNHVYRRINDELFEPSDPDKRNRFGELAKANNNLAYYYIWRENTRVTVSGFSARDTLNEALIPELRKWQTGDIVAGYALTYPTGSRADVRGKGQYRWEDRTWTLEISRPLVTDTPLQDVIFEPDPEAEYHFTISIFDASEQSHWGSEPQVLVFGPKDQDGAR